MLELKFKEHKELGRDGNHYEADFFTIGGYTVISNTSIDRYGHEYHGISINITNRRDETGTNKYLPDIYFDRPIGRVNAKFRIQTTSYGALDMTDYPVFLEAQRIAFDVAATLTARFLNK